MLRPGQLLALHRQGRLRSSFHPMSRLSGTSNMTTRANRQFPAAGLTPAGSAALQAAPHSGHTPLTLVGEIVRASRAGSDGPVFLPRRTWTVLSPFRLDEAHDFLEFHFTGSRTGADVETGE